MAKIFHYRTQSRKKLSIDRIRVTFFLVILCVVFLPLQANSQDTDYGTVIMPSTDPWNFTRYGNVPMNPYTGMQALNIPLYEYNDQDIKIPISLSYASDGMRPNRRAGSMGEGWFLNVGGVITREVRGIPDETYSIDYTGPDGYMKSSQGGYLGVHQNGLGNVSMFVTDGIKPETCYATKNGRFEVTADIFHFNFMGHSGSFILQPDGEVRTLDMSNPEVKVVVHYQRSIAYADMWFELITGDGYIYYFGENGLAREYMDKVHPDGSQNVEDDYPGIEAEQIYPMTWHLQQLVMPDNKRVYFDYYDYSEDFDYYHQSAGDEYEYYDNDDPRKQFLTYSPLAFLEVFSTSSSTGTILAPIAGSDVRITRTATRPMYIKSIRVGKTRIDFNYSRKYPAERITPLVAETLMRIPQLTSISVCETWTYGPEQKVFNVQFHYKPSVSNRLFLDRIEMMGGEYTMEYYDIDNERFPIMGTFGIDWWGYFNNYTANLPEWAMKQSYMPQAVSIDELNYSESYTLYTRNADHNLIASRMGMLKSITYPTKGKTEFEYEQHRYAKKLVVKSDVNDFLPTPVQENGIAGGVRIARITDITGNHREIREFIYENENGTPSGILLDVPRLSMLTAYRTPKYIVYNKKIQGQSLKKTTLDDTHIAYTTVKERRLDGSYIQYRYNDYEDYPDERGAPGALVVTEVVFPNDPLAPRKVFGRLDSKHFFRGSLKEKTIFDAQGTPQQKYNYFYSDSCDFYVSAPDCVGGVFFNTRLFSGLHKLIRTEKTDYFDAGPLKMSTDYYYNTLGQCIEESIVNSDGAILRTRRDYPNMRRGRFLLNHNMVNLLIGEVSTIQYGLGQKEYVTGWKYYDYGSNAKLYAERRLYDDPGIDSLAFTNFNDTPYMDIEADYNYNGKGYLCEKIDRSGVCTTYIYGYERGYVVAIVENAPLSEVVKIAGLEGIGQNWLAGPLSQEQYNALNTLPGAHVTMIDYLPGGVPVSITDPSGRTTYYDYDLYKRLTHISDEGKNLIERYEYNYKQY